MSVGPPSRPGSRPPALTVRLDPRLLTLAVCDLASFVALEEYGSFTAAAAALHLSQPGLSARVRRLERGLDIVLVDRSTRTLRFTPQGRQFLGEARTVLARLLEFQRRTHGEAGPVSPDP
jgi:DNA-binding transcriptional LysR family regulator